MKIDRGAIVLIFLLAGFTALWLTAPSRHLHDDGYDELAIIEAPAPRMIASHPGAESAAWAFYQIVKSPAPGARAIRAVQLWNALWLTTCLALFATHLWRRGCGWASAAGFVFWLGGLYATLHLALDPYLFYWPPAMALMGAALLCASRKTDASDAKTNSSDWPRWAALVLFNVAAILFNPMFYAFTPALLWGWWRGRVRGGWSPAAIAQALILVAAPGACYLLALQLGGVPPVAHGQYGHFSLWSLREAWRGLTGAFIAREHGVSLFGAIRGGGSFAAWAATGAVLVQGAVFAVFAFWSARLLTTRRALATAMVWGACLAAACLFLVWWDPGNCRFWLLPVLLAMAGWAGAMEGRTTRRFKIASAAALWVTGALFWTANLAGYVLPCASTPDPNAARAGALAERFNVSDLIVYPAYPRNDINYLAGLETSGMLILEALRAPGQSTFDMLRRRLEETRNRGGRLILRAPGEGEPWIPPEIAQHGRIDYAEEDFGRIEFGEHWEIAGERYAEVTGVH